LEYIRNPCTVLYCTVQQHPVQALLEVKVTQYKVTHWIIRCGRYLFNVRTLTAFRV
jgi:hypothetical protein